MEKENEENYFDEKNLENLVQFYEEQLIRVLQGENPMDVFTKHERGNLRKASILRYINNTWTITDKAIKYLRT
jgi:hypothetical protein